MECAHPLALEQDAHAISLELRDPLAPTLCAGCLRCFADHMQTAARKTDLRALRTNHEFWNRIMLFLTLKRTPNTRAAAERRLHLRLHSCPSQDRHVALASLSPQKLLHEVATALFSVVYVCLPESSPMVIIQRFSGRLWPSSPDDLLPHGDEDSFSALLNWFTILDRTAVSRAFLDIVLLCRSRLHTLLMRDANRRLFVKALCAHITAATARVRAGALGGDEDDGIDPAQRIAELGRMLDVLAYDTQPTFGRRLVHGLEDEVTQCVRAARDATPDAGAQSCLVRLAVMAHESRGIPIAQLPRDLQQGFMQELAQIGGSQQVLHNLLTRARSLPACAAPGCGHVGGKLNRCASCGVFRYCSKECQRMHWKTGEKPHKTFCAAIAALSPLLDASMDDFGRAYRAMDEDDRANVFYGLDFRSHTHHGLTPAQRLISTQRCRSARRDHLMCSCRNKTGYEAFRRLLWQNGGA